MMSARTRVSSAGQYTGAPVARATGATAPTWSKCVWVRRIASSCVIPIAPSASISRSASSPGSTITPRDEPLARLLLALVGGERPPGSPARLDRPGGVSAVLAAALALRLSHGIWSLARGASRGSKRFLEDPAIADGHVLGKPLERDPRGQSHLLGAEHRSVACHRREHLGEPRRPVILDVRRHLRESEVSEPDPNRAHARK